MQNVVYNLLMGAAGIGCCAFGALLLWHERLGWGWFLFAGFLLMGLMVYRKNAPAVEDDDE